MKNELVRYCLITGAAGGIGQSLVKIFTKAGYQVIGVDVKPMPAEIVCKYWYQFDLEKMVCDAEYAESFIQKIKSLVKGGGLHALINNAAIQILGGLDSLTSGLWNKTFSVNLLAPFLLIQGFSDELKEASGSVVNIGSIHAKLTKKNFVAYATSKSAMAGMTKALAVDIGSSFRINLIEPAAVETAMLTEGFGSDVTGYEKLASYHPVKKIGTPNEIAKLALFLCDEEMEFLHGASVSIDGGISAVLHDPN